MGRCVDCNGSGDKYNTEYSKAGKLVSRSKCPSCNGTGEAQGLEDKELKRIADKITTFLMIPATKDPDITKIPFSFWNEVIEEIICLITERVKQARQDALKEVWNEYYDFRSTLNANGFYGNDERRGVVKAIEELEKVITKLKGGA